MLAQASRCVMPFAMNIVGNGATDRNKLCPWQHRRKPAVRQRHFDDVPQEHASFTRNYSRFPIKRDKPVETTGH